MLPPIHVVPMYLAAAKGKIHSVHLVAAPQFAWRRAPE